MDTHTLFVILLYLFTSKMDTNESNYKKTKHGKCSQYMYEIFKSIFYIFNKQLLIKPIVVIYLVIH